MVERQLGNNQTQEREGQQCVDIRRAHTFADGSSVVALGNAEQTNTVVFLKPKEVLVRTRITPETTEWMGKRLGEPKLQFSSEPFWAVADTSKETTFKVLDTRTARSPQRYEQIEGSKPEDGRTPNFIPDSPKVYDQKQNVKAALVKEFHAGIRTGAAVEIFRDGERIYYAMPATAEMSAKSAIQGDPQAQIESFRTPQELVKAGQHLVMAVEGDTVEFVSTNSLRKIPSDMIGSLKDTTDKTVGSRTKAVSINGPAKTTVEGYAVAQILSGADTQYPAIQLPKAGMYSPEDDWQRKIGKLPEPLAEYLRSDWFEKQKKEAKGRQQGNRVTPRADDPKSFSGHKEALVRYLLTQPEDTWEDIVREYIIREINLPKDTLTMTRNQGLRQMKNPDASLGRLYNDSHKFLEGKTWEEIAQAIDKVRDPNLKQSLQATYKGTDLSLRAQRVDVLSRTLAASRLDRVARGIGRRNFDKDAVGQEQIILRYEDVYDAEAKRLSESASIVDQYNAIPLEVNPGPEKQIVLESTEGPFHVFPEYETQYPQVVIDAIGRVYKRYNKAMTTAMNINTEWKTDYRHAKTPQGEAVNRWVQIDMKGLSPAFLEAAKSMRPEVLEQVLLENMFEIENSLAMYQLLQRIFADESGDSLFNREFRTSLDELSAAIEKPIAILTETPEKYKSVRESEFGELGDHVSDADVKRLSGFDRLFGPEEFLKHLEENGGQSAYALYARLSLPLSWLEDPTVEVTHPLLGDPRIRRVIKENAITLNVDNPDWRDDPRNRHRSINDTKVGYMQEMGMGYVIDADKIPWAIEGEELVLEPDFEEFLKRRGVNPEHVRNGRIMLRTKPGGESYGCYGHHRPILTRNGERQALENELVARGAYIVQPEMRIPKLTVTSGEDDETEEDKQSFDYIDRVFMRIDQAGDPRFMGGFRTLIPSESIEAKNGRHHGTDFTRWAPIVNE